MARRPRLDLPDAVPDPGRRRALALLAGAAPLLTAAGRGLVAAPATAAPARPSALTQAPPGIVKPLPPEWFTVRGTNAETRWEALRRAGLRGPERPVLRAQPHLDAAHRPARPGGCGVGQRRAAADSSSTYDDLRRLPARTITAVIECAGNGRSFFADQQGTPASGHGVAARRRGRRPLARRAPGRRCSHRAGLRREAVDVMPEGLDAPVVSCGVDQGHVRRPLPIAKALDDVLVAYEMNGEPLPPDHGFPARLVVPGWVGIAWIKWLGSIEVADHPLTSPWNTTSYRMIGPDYPADSPPLTAQPPKSAFELPWEAELPPGRPLMLTRPLVVGRRPGPPGRREHRRRGVVAQGPPRPVGPGPALGALEPAVGAPGRGATSCWPGPPAATAWPSPTPCPSTSSATSSGPSCGIPWSRPEPAMPDASPPLVLAVALDGAGHHPAAWRDPAAAGPGLFDPAYWARWCSRRGGLLDLVTFEDTFGPPAARRPDARVDRCAPGSTPRWSRPGWRPADPPHRAGPGGDDHPHRAVPRRLGQRSRSTTSAAGRAGWQARVSARPADAALVGVRPRAGAVGRRAVRRGGRRRRGRAAAVGQLGGRRHHPRRRHRPVHRPVEGCTTSTSRADTFSREGPVDRAPPAAGPAGGGGAGPPAGAPTSFAARAADVVFVTPAAPTTPRPVVAEVRGGRGRRSGGPASRCGSSPTSSWPSPGRRRAAAARLGRLDELAGAAVTLRRRRVRRHRPGAGRPARRRPAARARRLPPAPGRARAATWARSSTSLVPELQRRGLFRRAYPPATLRERLGLPRPPAATPPAMSEVHR